MTPGRLHPRWQADLALAGITLIWGSTFVVVKAALADVSTLLFLAIRFSVAALLLLFVFRGRLGSAGRGPALKAGSLTGLCLFAGYAFQTFGLRYTTPSKSAFLTGMSIVMVPVLIAIRRRRPPHLSEALGVAVATAGLGLMTLGRFDLAISGGDLLTLACALMFALHILVLGHYAPQVPFEQLSLIQIATAAVLAGASCGWVEPAHIRWTAGVVTALVITGALATALAFTVQSWAQRHTTPIRTALILALEPVFAWLTSFVFAGELLAPGAAAGAAMILSGIVLVELKPIGRRLHP